MNKNDFLDAVANVDSEILDNVLRERAKLARAPKRKSAILMRVIPIAAAVAILATCVIATFSMANRNKPEVPGADDPAVVPPVVDTEPERTNTIVEGAFKLVQPSVSRDFVQSWEGCAYAEAYSYYLKNEKIYIKVNYGFLDNDFADKLAAGETDYPDWHPEYTLVNPNPTLRCYASLGGFGINNNYENVLINGSSKYFHVFDEDIPDFGCVIEPHEWHDPESDETKIYVTPIFNCSEVVEFDFSNVPVGTSGKILFHFGWSEPDNPDEFDARGVAGCLYFYVGENGIGFSAQPAARGRANAKENAEKIENARSSTAETEEFNGWNESVNFGR